MANMRDLVRKYLQAHPAATAAEIAQALLSPIPGIRHHLRKMVQEGMLSVVGKEPARGRGRPVLLYRLARPYADDNFLSLSDALLNSLMDSPLDKAGQIRRIADHLLAEVPAPSGSRTRILNLAVRALNRYPYSARWEARPNGPWIFLGNCPYAAILEKHPELCDMDAQMIRSLTGESFNQIIRQSLSSRDQPNCVFCLTTPGQNPPTSNLQLT